jgi:putative endonuclease
MAYCYILHSVLAGKFYIGHTNGPIQERLRKHNSRHKGYTGRFHDWVIVYCETFDLKVHAYRRELEIKSWKSKSRIEQLIADSDPPGRSAGRVWGSNPSAPTKPQISGAFFVPFVSRALLILGRHLQNNRAA